MVNITDAQMVWAQCFLHFRLEAHLLPFEFLYPPHQALSLEFATNSSRVDSIKVSAYRINSLVQYSPLISFASMSDDSTYCRFIFFPDMFSLIEAGHCQIQISYKLNYIH